MAKRTINNPAVELFNRPAEELPTAQGKLTKPAADTESERLVISPTRRECRTQRKQILLRPSVHAEAMVKCNKIGISLNEAINQLLQNWINMEQ
jgi:hypothetical protein